MHLNIKIISAGAGSGKTYRLTGEMVRLLEQGVRASGIVATTFTQKAAAELQERVRVRLLEAGMTQQADDLANALIGTVHSLGVRLLRRFAFEAGVSPQVDIIADEDQQTLFNQSLATVLTQERVELMNRLSERLGLVQEEGNDWRREVRALCDVARANDFSIETLERSKVASFQAFQQFLGKPDPEKTEAAFAETLENMLADTIRQVQSNGDSTKKTQDAVRALQDSYNELRLRGELNWRQWAKIGKTDPGAKSRDDVAPLREFAQTHETHPAFHRDIQDYLYALFGLSIEAIREYDRYKKQRGLIDYTDMEALVVRLLENDAVRAVLSEEIDMLLVDEFQDTSPIQLEIFLRLSKIAKHSIWVGDPKQSIYGFRGAEPRLMEAIVQQSGGIRKEDILEHSWRSREDIVYAANAIFTKAFPKLPPEQVALSPKRRKLATADSANKENEPIEASDALIHWHFRYDGEGRPPGSPWMENCIATNLRQFLQSKVLILPKGETQYRPARPGDVAILCRSNAACQIMAEALHRAGLKAAIARAGLLQTAESKLILACLRYMLNRSDALSVAEILLLAAEKPIEAIIEDRLEYLELIEQQAFSGRWAEREPVIRELNALREQASELSSTEILSLVLDALDLRRIMVSWGSVQQRLDNVDALRKLARQYEDNCNRLHAAASLAGFLLWLNDLEAATKDHQGSGENPDAVNVMTYHKSKGLEWPIVVCSNLDNKLKAELWGMDIVPETEEIDLDNVLGNRRLRYWVNPYGNQQYGTPMQARMEESPEKALKMQQAQEEEVRLLYVGLTRARDYLIFTDAPHKSATWLNRVWHEGHEDYPTLDASSGELPWEWNGQFLYAQTETFIYPRDFTHTDPEEAPALLLTPAAGRQSYPAYAIDLNKKDAVPQTPAKAAAALYYAERLAVPIGGESYALAKAVKAFLHADHTDYEPAIREQMATTLLGRFEVDETIEATALTDLSKQWQAHLTKQFNPKRSLRKYPVRYFQDRRLFATVIDLLLETDHGLVLIQNSGFGGDAKQLERKAGELGSWLHLSKKAVQALFKAERVRTFVHFVLHSAVVEVETKEAETLF